MPTITDTKILFIDIETSASPDCDLFKPTFKEPRTTQKGEMDKRDKSIEEQEQNWKSNCALDPLTGQVLMVGYNYLDESSIDFIKNPALAYEVDEAMLMRMAVDNITRADLVIGHYLKSFDLPFIINRCRKHGITRPEIGYMSKGRWYWSEKVIDLRDLWTLGQYNEHISLNNMAKYFGLEPKDEEIGKNFQQVFESDLEKAIGYCKHDVELTKEIYNKLK